MPNDRKWDINCGSGDQTMPQNSLTADTLIGDDKATLLSAKTSLDSEPDRETIGPYHLEKIIGEGGMGRVYMAVQSVPIKRRVALKMVKRGLATEEFIARFESERQALAVMDHPCIAKVLDAGATDDGKPYFVMEYVDGIPLNAYCDEHKLGIRERLNLFVKVCEGVQHAHQKAIIHRDLKPSNVLVTTIDDQAIPKIIDFGVAKVIDDGLLSSTMQTGVGQLVGTPEYMSPEQANMDSASVDTTTDVYALGVLLYELLVGELPFSTADLKEKGFQEILRIIREVEPQKPSTRLKTMSSVSVTSVETVALERAIGLAGLRRSLNGDLDWITMKALEKEKVRRYQTANALAMDIRRHLQFEPVLACPPSPTYRMQKFVRRNRVWVGAAAFVLTAIILGITGTTVGLIRAIRAEQHAQREAEAARQVSDFLVELFEVSDPGQARGNSITAREILDAGSQRIETELVDQPLTQSRLMNTIGKVYRNLGLYDDASPKLESALALLQSTPGSSSLVMATSQADLAEVYIDQAKYAEAEAMLKQALDLMEGKQGESNLQLARGLGELAVVYRRQGRFDEAEPLYSRSHEIYVAVLGPNDPQVAQSFNGLAILNYQRGNYDKSEALYFQALDLWRRAYGTDHADIAKGLNNLALLYHHQDRYEDALPRYEEASVIYEKVLGPDHSRFARSLNNLALLYHEMGRYQEAEPLYLRSLKIKEKSLGSDHPEAARTLNNLANLYRDQDEFNKASTYYRQALTIRENSLGPEHPDVAWTLRDIACLKHELGQTDEALGHFERAVLIYSNSLGADHPDLEEILLDYSRVMRESNFPARADSLDQLRSEIAIKNAN